MGRLAMATIPKGRQGSGTVASSDYGYRGRTQMRANVTSHLYRRRRRKEAKAKPSTNHLPRANGGHPI